MITMFKTGVMPVLEYGAGLWGVGCVREGARDNEWKGVESFWVSVARYILHAPAKTNISAITGDLNWLPFSVRVGFQLSCTVLHSMLSMLDDACLVRKAMGVQRKMVNSGRPCWLANFKTLIVHLNDTYLNNIWNEWIDNGVTSRFNTRIMRIKRLRFDIVNMQEGIARGPSPREEMIGLDRLIEEALVRRDKDEWVKDLDREGAKRGEGGNKLRTYRLFKSDICFEPYLANVFDVRKRAMLFKFRAGVAPLRIETGRYELRAVLASDANNKKARKKYTHLHANERICWCCGSCAGDVTADVEDEFHFLCMCPTYFNERFDLIKACTEFNMSLDNDCEESMRINCDDPHAFFIGIMGTHDYMLNNCLADYIWKSFKIREIRMNELNV